METATITISRVARVGIYRTKSGWRSVCKATVPYCQKRAQQSLAIAHAHKTKVQITAPQDKADAGLRAAYEKALKTDLEGTFTLINQPIAQWIRTRPAPKSIVKLGSSTDQKPNAEVQNSPKTRFRSYFYPSNRPPSQWIHTRPALKYIASTSSCHRTTKRSSGFYTTSKRVASPRKCELNHEISTFVVVPPVRSNRGYGVSIDLLTA